MQAVADPQCQFLNLFVGYQGSMIPELFQIIPNGGHPSMARSITVNTLQGASEEYSCSKVPHAPAKGLFYDRNGI